jgi:hypothetical protein
LLHPVEENIDESSVDLTSEESDEEKSFTQIGMSKSDAKAYMRVIKKCHKIHIER